MKKEKQCDITLILQYIKEHTDSTYPQVDHTARKQSQVQKSAKNISNKRRERDSDRETDTETKRKTVALTQSETDRIREDSFLRHRVNIYAKFEELEDFIIDLLQ